MSILSRAIGLRCSVSTARHLCTGSARQQKEARSNPGRDTLPKIPNRNKYDLESCEIRRKWVEEQTGADLTHLGGWWADKDVEPSILKGNIENPIGMVRIPVAVAGPMLFKGSAADGTFFLPMVTTEGALVASVTRGAACLNLAGGVETHTGSQTMTRCPLFLCDNLEEAHKLGQWIQDSIDDIRQITQQHSRFAKLKTLQPVYDEKACHIVFSYETGDAAGQNMVTVTTMGALQWIRKNAPVNITHAYVTGSCSGDKKPCDYNRALGRGMSVSARVTIPESVLNEVLNVRGESLLQWFHWAQRANYRMGSPQNFNFSNVLSSSFAATGQDFGCVGESQTAVLNMVPNPAPEGGIIASNHYSSMVVGTVGGGTGLPTQKACLDIVGCSGVGKVRKLAEIIAGYSLALDLSTISAVTVDEFSDAHARLGRNRPEDNN